MEYGGQLQIKLAKKLSQPKQFPGQIETPTFQHHTEKSAFQ